MKYLYLYIIDGWPSIAISYRPKNAKHIVKRVYYRLSGSTVIRFFAANHTTHSSTHDGISIITVTLKGFSPVVLKGGIQ